MTLCTLNSFFFFSFFFSNFKVENQKDIILFVMHIFLIPTPLFKASSDNIEKKSVFLCLKINNFYLGRIYVI